MFPTLHKEDVLIIGHYLGTILTLLAVAMMAPFVLALFLGEYEPALYFLLSVGITLTAGGCMRLMKISPGRITGRQAMIVTGFTWIFAALFAAIPLTLSGNYNSYLDAVFESMSGFTTTGLTLANDIDHMAASMNMWRFLMQFIGGQGILVAAISLGIFGRGGSGAALSFYDSEGRSDHILPNVRYTSRFIWSVSSIIIGLGGVVAAIAALFAGLTPLRAVLHGFWLSIAAFDTGGFAPQAMGLMHYHSYVVESVIMVIGCLGALSFVLFAALTRGDTKEIFKNYEIQTFAVWAIAILTLGMGALAAGSAFSSFGSMVRRGLFMIISAVSNTGFSVVYISQLVGLMTGGLIFAIILAMAVGGAAGSTSGGIKVMRVGIVAKTLFQSFKNVLLPESAVSTASYHHKTRILITSEVSSAALTITIIYIFTYILGGVVGIALGYDAIPALFESVSAASNTGLSAGVTTTTMPAVLKIIYIIQMLAGRLEFITLFAAAYIMIASVIPKRSMRKHG